MYHLVLINLIKKILAFVVVEITDLSVNVKTDSSLFVFALKICLHTTDMHKHSSTT